MCGLIGYSGEENYNLTKLKFIMYWNSVERGRDATGIFTPNSDILKDNNPAAKFFLGKEIEKLKEDNTVIAHVRAKTIGANTARNAHPFKSGSTILAHNGTLIEPSKLASKYEIKAFDWDVDSQIITQAIDKAFKKEGKVNFDVIGEYRGAAALLFYNEETGYLYAFHDKERTLFYGFDTDGGMYISSLEEPLKSLNLFEIQAFECNTVYTIKNGSIIEKELYPLYEEVYKEEIAAEKEREKNKGALRRSGKLKYPKLKASQRGFVGNDDDTKGHLFVGYWLKAKWDNLSAYRGTYGPGAVIRRNKWYLCTGYFDVTTTPVVELEGENGKGQVYISTLDCENFIPIAKDYVIFMKDVKSEKGGILLWKKDDVVEVIKTDLEKATVLLYHELSNFNYNVPTAYIRLAEQDEIELNEEPPFDSSLEESESIGNLLLEMRNQESNDTSVEEEYIDKRILEGFANRINKSMNSLEEKYLANEDITTEINEINATLNLSTDKELISTFKNNI